MPKPKPNDIPRYDLYGLSWAEVLPPVYREMQMVQKGGQWKGSKGQTIGNGLFFHFKELAKLIWGAEFIWHRWADFFLENWLKYKYVGVMGPKNSSKSCCAAVFHLLDYYCFPSCTTTIVCSTTKEDMEDRVWGEIKRYHRLAQNAYEWLPGHLIEGRMRLVTDDRDEAWEGRDFRNGFVGLPCKKGNTFVGLSSFVGRKNKRVRMLGDELQFLPASFLDATANLDGSGGRCDFKLTGMGNPSEITNSLGMLCEPSMEMGGWESGIDQQPKTKCWPTRINSDGICVQLPGSDSPNMDSPPESAPPFPFLITRKQLETDAARWGTDDWHYMMFDEGRMPRGQGSRRVITRQLCERGRAKDEPVWKDSNRIRIGSLDAAFRAVGGDRCVFTRAEFGVEAPVLVDAKDGSLLISQEIEAPSGRTIFAMIEQKIIPISAAESRGAALTIEEAEDQIVKFVMAECQTHSIPPEHFGFDAGMKASLVAAFARLWSPKVVPIDFGGKPTERKVSREIELTCREYYFNFVTELWYSTRMVIDAGQFRGLTENVMLEGCKREFEKVAGNKIQVEPKDEMKKKTGESPDCFDSLVIAIEMARRLGFVIAKFESTPASEESAVWKREVMQKAKSFWRSGQLSHA
jgi:hypothetical protein